MAVALVGSVRHMRTIDGVVRNYAWGDQYAIPRLLDVEPDGRPWAELWLGTHPVAPSYITGDGALAAVSGELPYLLKLLAAGQPLSLQTHPTRAQAEAGFDREEALGLTFDAPTRVYRDRMPKPEVLCALTEFDALCGFRHPAATAELLGHIGATDLADHLANHGLGDVVAALYERRLPIEATLAACARSARPEAGLVNDLIERYPGDPSVVITLLLNRVVLAPGEAIFLGPGNLHAYIHGVGVEVMSASDNVVRGGLTLKHVDVAELLRVLDLTPLLEPIIRPVEVRPGRWRYDSIDTPFRLWRLLIDETLQHTATGRELLLCTDGDAGAIHRGQCAYLARNESITLEGPATVFRVEETLPGL